MKIAVALSLLATAAQSPPQRLDDPASDAAFAEKRAVIACVDRFLDSPQSDALIGSYLENTPFADLIGNDLAKAGQLHAPATKAGRAKVDACAAGMSPSRLKEPLELYVGLSLAERGLSGKLRAASIDVGRLASFDLNDVMSHKISAADTESFFKKIGVTKPDEEEVIRYLLVHKLNAGFSLIMHPPAHPARRISGEIFDTDYPQKAKAASREGKSDIIYEVSATGVVDGCEVFLSSGTELLDQTACKLVMERFRYEPAHNEQGRPVSQKIEKTIQWRLIDMPKAAPPPKP